MRAARPLLALGALAAATVVATPARAAVPLELTWDAPAECPPAAEVRAEFARLARIPPGRTPPRLSVEAHVEARGGRWHLRLRTLRDGVAGERELEAESCQSLARAAPLVMALALGFEVETREPPPPPDPGRVRPPPPPRPRPVEAPPAAPAPAPPPPPPPVAPVVVVVARPSPTPALPVRWTLALEARGAWRGLLPGGGFGTSLGLDVARDRWLASVRADAWLPTDEPTSAAGVHERFTAFGGTASLCALTRSPTRAVFAGCLGARAAAVRAEVSGAPINHPWVAPWLAAVPAVRARVRLVGPLHADAGLELAVSLDRPTFKVDNLPEVVAVPRLVPAAVLGISADL